MFRLANDDLIDCFPHSLFSTLAVKAPSELPSPFVGQVCVPRSPLCGDRVFIPEAIAKADSRALSLSFDDCLITSVSYVTPHNINFGTTSHCFFFVTNDFFLVPT